MSNDGSPVGNLDIQNFQNSLPYSWLKEYQRRKTKTCKLCYVLAFLEILRRPKLLHPLLVFVEVLLRHGLVALGDGVQEVLHGDRHVKLFPSKVPGAVIINITFHFTFKIPALATGNDK